MWIARDADQTLYIYMSKPKRDNINSGYFVESDYKGYYQIPYTLCPEITWENSPREIESINIKLK